MPSSRLELPLNTFSGYPLCQLGYDGENGGRSASRTHQRLFCRQPLRRLGSRPWCEQPDFNRYGFLQTGLSRSRLAIPPCSQNYLGRTNEHSGFFRRSICALHYPKIPRGNKRLRRRPFGLFLAPGLGEFLTRSNRCLRHSEKTPQGEQSPTGLWVRPHPQSFMFGVLSRSNCQLRYLEKTFAGRNKRTRRF